ncbi:MAG: TIGR03960 family B12-binding radical SAM protein, partial [Actinobacteria bacterium]|nr:TIGR03960 family B12-binding radical SAM protein [Actinomycetota bacterium]
MKNISLNEINKILSLVQKPARYINSEWNSVHKDHQKVDVKVALAYPDVYEIGASNLGLQIIYEILNQREDVAAERVYAPWNDLEEILRNRNIPLFTLESKSPVASFDIFGFTLQYEMTFTNILNMLSLAGIPLYSSERDNSYPLIIGGGPCAFNPEPLALFFDFFVLGDGEEAINEIIDCYKKNKTKSRQEILESLSQIEGVYIPSFYQVDYDSDGIIRKVNPLKENIPFPVNKRVVSDLEKFDFPRHPIVPFVNIVHDRCSIEIMRGCTRGCRFCQAGMIYRPVRERSLEKVTEMAKNLIRETGYDEISFASLSSSDYSSIEKVFENLRVEQERDKIAVSLPSLRVDAFSVELAKQVQKTRKTGLTFAPEAGTQRLRDVINKCVIEEDLYNALRSAFEAGWRKIKLYFMIGLPTETMEDLKGIVDLCDNAVNLGLSIVPKKDRRQIKIKVSVSSFVPKAVTPFQWVKQDPLLELKEKQQYLQANIK